jgi:hypothetical protein
VDLLERYLEAVRQYLPQVHADDIVAELGDDLRQQLEDREASLGRALNEDEVAGILKDRGHPMQVSGAYLPTQFLIGPALYPAWRFIVKLVLGWILPPVFAFIVGPTLFLTSTDRAGALLATAVTLFQAEIFALGCVTAVFAILERTHAKVTVFSHWDPRKLPRVRSILGEGRISRTKAASEIVSSVIATAVWIAVMENGARPVTLGAVVVTPAPVWLSVEWAVLLVCAAGMPLGWFGWVRPYAIRTRSIGRLAIDAASGGIIAVLLHAGTWVSLAVPSNPGAEANVTRWVNVGFEMGLIFTVGILAADAFVELIRLFPRLRRRHAPASSIVA